MYALTLLANHPIQCLDYSSKWHIDTLELSLNAILLTITANSVTKMVLCLLDLPINTLLGHYLQWSSVRVWERSYLYKKRTTIIINTKE